MEDRILTLEQLADAVLKATRLPRTPYETGWRNIAKDQDISTLKAVGKWLSKAATSDKPMVAIVFGIVDLKQGRMPELKEAE